MPGLAWLTLYVGLALLPLAVAQLVNSAAASASLVEDAAVGLGFVAFALAALQFSLVSRLAGPARPFGADALMQFHRAMGFATLVFVLAHAALLTGRSVRWAAWNPLGGAPATQPGAIALWAAVVLIATSAWRTTLHIPYERWRLIHLIGAGVFAGGAVVHMLRSGRYSSSAAVRTALAAYAGLFLVMLIRYRGVRPLLLTRRPWRVVDNRDLGANTRLLRLRPEGHQGFLFEPGQFAWLMTGSTPLWAEQHPLSIASSAQPAPDGAIEFAVKDLGDWSGTTVPRLAEGTRVWVDGPYGAFSPARDSTGDLVLIAGGIGIAPMRSILRTLGDRQDRRLILLVYAAADAARLPFGEEVDRLAERLNLRVVYVVEYPDSDWSGERGLLTADVLHRHLPEDFRTAQYLVCGPPAMMDAVESCLAAAGVPPGSVQTERFQVV